MMDSDMNVVSTEKVLSEEENYRSSDHENSSHDESEEGDTNRYYISSEYISKGDNSDSDSFEEEVIEQLEEVVDEEDDIEELHPLPPKWTKMYHRSGIPVYHNAELNVCSLSRPYLLGVGSAKIYGLPSTGIPCATFRRLDNTKPEFERVLINKDTGVERWTEPEIGSSDGGPPLPKKNERANTKVFEYCKRALKFRTIAYKKFCTWDARRSYYRAVRNERNRRQHTDNMVVIPIEKRNEEGRLIFRKKWVLDSRNKTYVAVLHEFLQHILKSQPIYDFQEVANARTPFAATILIDDDPYGTGVGMSKKEAKLKAAKHALEVLLPKMRHKLAAVCERTWRGTQSQPLLTDPRQDDAWALFDDVCVKDPRVTDMSRDTLQPLPYEILEICVKRKSRLRDDQILFQINKNQYTMSVGSYSATVEHENKRAAKQLVAQILLAQLHPHLQYWGSLLRLYCKQSYNESYNALNSSNSSNNSEEESQTNSELITKLRERMTDFLPNKKWEDDNFECDDQDSGSVMVKGSI